MVKTLTTVVVAASLCWLLTGTGCHMGAADYWPMAEGNLWTYRYLVIGMAQDSTPDTTIVEDAMAWKCGELVTLDSGIKAWAMSVGPSDSVYFREVGNAVLLYEDASDAEPDTWLALPLQEGKTWTYAGGTMLVREQGTVEVPAGTYKNCWRVQMLAVADQGGTSIWFAPNVGMVLMEQSYDYGGYTYGMRYELTYAKVK
jgi:hypothetical protein